MKTHNTYKFKIYQFCVRIINCYLLIHVEESH